MDANAAESGQSSSQNALNHARTEISVVNEELKKISGLVGRASQRVIFESANAVAQAIRHTKETETRYDDTEQLGVSAAELSKQLRHAELDCASGKAREIRLLEERAALLTTQASLENELKRIRKELEDARLRLRHRELDVQELAPSTWQSKCPDSAPPAQATSDPDNPQDSLLYPPFQQQVEVFSTWHLKAEKAMHKKQAIAKIKILSSQLEAEKLRRIKLEGRSAKDDERLHSMTALVQRQQVELKFLRQRVYDKLENMPIMTAAGPSSTSSRTTSKVNVSGGMVPDFSCLAASTKGSKNGGQASGGGIQRSASTPTSLPAVVPKCTNER